MMKKLAVVGACVLGMMVMLAGCAKTEKGSEAETGKESFLGDAVIEEDGELTQIGEAEEGWEASRDKALKEAESDGSKDSGERFDRTMSEQIINLVNAEREKRGLNTLVVDEMMMNAAETRAKEQKTSFSHTRPDGSNNFTVFAQFEIPANYRGENLACGGIYSAETVMNMWMQSEGHAANILNTRFSRIGVGYFTSGKYGYWCQLFAN